MANFAKEDFQATLESEEIMDFSDTQEIDNLQNIFQTKLPKAIDNMLHLKLYHKKSENEKKNHG